MYRELRMRNLSSLSKMKSFALHASNKNNGSELGNVKFISGKYQKTKKKKKNEDS